MANSKIGCCGSVDRQMPFAKWFTKMDGTKIYHLCGAVHKDPCPDSSTWFVRITVGSKVYYKALCEKHELEQKEKLWDLEDEVRFLPISITEFSEDEYVTASIVEEFDSKGFSLQMI